MEDEFRRWRVPLFGAIVVVWGLNYLFVVAGLQLSPPLWLASLRALFGVLGVVGLLAWPNVRTSLDARGARDALLIGIPTTGLFFGLWFVAAASVLPGIAAIVIYTFPLWVALLSSPVLGYPIGRAHWAVVGAGFAGVALIAQPWASAGSPVPPVALIELLLAAVSWAVGTVLFQRRFAPRQYSAATVYQMAGGAAALVALSLIFEPRGFPQFTPELWYIVLWLGLVGTAFAYTVWYGLLARTPAATLSAYVFLVPVVALGASAVVYGERLALDQLFGVAVVLLALYVLGLVNRRRPAATASAPS